MHSHTVRFSPRSKTLYWNVYLEYLVELFPFAERSRGIAIEQFFGRGAGFFSTCESYCPEGNNVEVFGCILWMDLQPRTVVWLVACNDAIPASSGNDIQVPVVRRKQAFLRNEWYFSIPYGGGWDVSNCARTMFCFEWEKGQDVSFGQRISNTLNGSGEYIMTVSTFSFFSADIRVFQGRIFQANLTSHAAARSLRIHADTTEEAELIYASIRRAWGQLPWFCSYWEVAQNSSN